MKKATCLTLSALLIAGCAQKAALEPAPGETLPPPPYGATQPLDADQLLELDPQAAPERSIELRRESEEREDDPFDLPPEDPDDN
ncbi:hypothetical protein [Aurantiacibacter gangjinensis]|uniref:Argininosuccinate lyase n=1 Tax=Aurantiacibacter gangjinensis TaxID=502682 RepID=A0A0G9MN52_9SPHN|nr:hypothetical protein [Aurantiacibacter gangjinensis]APE28183.1 hypothetical protein BMF35_a1354 [Aurantiacibacter gangjinensis]KLE32089.1 argininosuccinate lyase [Aurantiacibacter gangjinensis]